MYKAKVSFSGLNISMAEGDVGEISDIALAEDLLRAGDIEEVEEPKKKKEAKK